METTPHDEIRRIFGAQHAASRQTADIPWEIRRDRLKRLMALVKKNRKIIAQKIHEDFYCRATAETLLLEVFPTLEGIRCALKHGKGWMKPQNRSSSFWFMPAKNRIYPQPKGVIGIIAPWNYPLYLTAGPLTCAFAAGNRAMVKLSESAPAFAQWFKETVPQYFAEDELAVINGEAETAAQFTALPFDHICFTGGGSTAKHVMRAAAENLTPLTLELGGKSPALILEDADMERAAAAILGGKLKNAGQTCVSPDYVLLPAGKTGAFIENAVVWSKKHYPKLKNGRDYTHIINARQFDRLQSLLQEAQERGASVVRLGKDSPDKETRFMPPYLIHRLPEDCKLLDEEIFGPLLPIVEYENLQQALDYIAGKDRPLAAYFFSDDKTQTDKLLMQTISGGACVNDTIYHVAQDNLPFGGIGPSGMGAYHGKTGFDEFSHFKGVFLQSRFNGTGLLAPPYGAKFKSMIKLLIR